MVAITVLVVGAMVALAMAVAAGAYPEGVAAISAGWMTYVWLRGRGWRSVRI